MPNGQSLLCCKITTTNIKKILNNSNNHITCEFVWHAHRSFGDVTKSIRTHTEIETHTHTLIQMISIESYMFRMCIQTARESLQTGWISDEIIGWLAGYVSTCLCYIILLYCARCACVSASAATNSFALHIASIPNVIELFTHIQIVSTHASALPLS